MTPQSLLDSLHWRYATKTFDSSKKIPPEDWDALEQSMVLTPSSFGLQPWKFITVTDQNIKDALLPHSWNQHQISECSHLVVLCAKEKLDAQDIDAFLNSIAETRQVTKESLEDYAGMMRGFIGRMDDAALLTWAKNQVYIALGQLMSSAAMLRIDACPMEGITPAEYDRILGLDTADTKDKYRTTVACAMGYRSAEDKYATTPKVRFPLEQIISSHP